MSTLEVMEQHTAKLMAVGEWLTIQEAADLLRVHRTTVYKLFRTGKLPYSKIAGLEGRRIKREDLDKLLQVEDLGLDETDQAGEVE
jgi:excisionase family DNA binding protein